MNVKNKIKISIIVNFLNYNPGYKTKNTMHEKILRVKIKKKTIQKIQNKKNTIKIMNFKIAIKNKSKGNT
jgi:hypothetical protein